MGVLPPKLFFRIGEVAGLVGVEPHVLRYWEREFRSIRPSKSAKGQRVYSRKDVENLLRVRDLLYRDGFTIAGAKKKLQSGEVPGPLHPAAAEPSGPISAPSSSSEPSAIEQEACAQEASEDASEHEVDEIVAPPSAPSTPHVREKLIALRSEVEAFLAELSSGGRY